MAKKGWQKDVRANAQRIWLAGLGAMARAEEEGSKLFTSLVQEGERFQSKGKVQWDEVRREVERTAKKARREAEGAVGKIEKTFDRQVSRTLRRVGVPTRDEISALARRVEELTSAVDRLRARQPVASAAARGGVQAAGKRGSSAGTSKAGASRVAASKAAASKARSSRPGAAGTAVRKAAARRAPARPAPLPEKITTADDVTTTADVKTGPV